MTALRWIASFSATAVYAADAIRRQIHLVDDDLAAALDAPAARFIKVVATSGLPVERVWGHLLPLAALNDTPRHLVEVALTKAVGKAHAQHHIDHLADRLNIYERAYKGAVPNFFEQLELRSAALRDQWEAQGPGLLKAIERRTEHELLAPQGTIALVQPVLGGGGLSFPGFNTVLFEAVLTNPIAELPEVVRLAWLVAQLNLELPRFQGDLRRERAIQLGSWAMVLATLQAAEELGLAHCDVNTVWRALMNWRVRAPKHEQFAPDLMSWWETYLAERPSWAVAITALDMLLETDHVEH